MPNTYYMATGFFTKLIVNLSKHYSRSAFAVQVRVRITFGLLLSFIPITIVAFMPSLLTRAGSKLGLIITLLSALSFFVLLIFLLKRGLRETTNTALTAGLFLIIIMTYVTGAPNYDSTAFLDRFVAVALMQLAMCVLISEKRRYLLFSFLSYICAIVGFLVFAQLPLIPQSMYQELSGSYLRDVVIFVVGFVSLLFINIVTHRIISLHALSEERLSKLNSDLEMLVKERTTRLILTEKKNSINILVAGINHQLNTPLGNVVTTVSALQLRSIEDALVKGLPADMSHKLLSSIKLIGENANRMASLLESFKQLSVDAVKRENHSCDLGEIVQSVVEALGDVFASHKIECSLDIEQNCVTRTNDHLLAQVLSIVYANAIEHGFASKTTDENFPKRIWTSVKRESDFFVLKIGNNGVPLTASARENLFEAFYTTQHAQGKNGLGLYIAKNIVNQDLRGTLEFEKSDDNETVFRVALPVE